MSLLELKYIICRAFMYVLIQLSDLVRAIEESSLSPISPAKY